MRPGAAADLEHVATAHERFHRVELELVEQGVVAPVALPLVAGRKVVVVGARIRVAFARHGLLGKSIAITVGQS